MTSLSGLKVYKQFRTGAWVQKHPWQDANGRQAWLLSHILQALLLAFKHFGCDSFAVSFV